MRCFVLIAVLLAPLPSRAADPPATQATTRASTATATVRMLIQQVGTTDPSIMASQISAMGEPIDAPQAMKDAANWIKGNLQSLQQVTPAKLPAMPWGAATFHAASGDEPAKLYLHVLDWHASGKVIVYGLSSQNVKRAYLLREPAKDLHYTPTTRDTIIEVAAKNAKAPDPVDTVVVVELSGEPQLNTLHVAQAEDGSVLLHAKDAVVVGSMLRYEPEPTKNTLGYWMVATDWAYWQLELQKAQSFEVELLQGCGKGSGGAEVVVTSNGMSLTMTVQDTGHFQNFVPRVIGKLRLPAGKSKLEVHALTKPGAAIMDLRQITLKPAKE